MEAIIITRAQKLKWSTISSLLQQIVSLVSGFILPVLILEKYGSEVNGLVNSIGQFLGAISLVELGIGAVIQSSLYKPLANKDSVEISKVYVSANKFFKKISYIFIIYTLVLVFAFPIFTSTNFDFVYIACLIFAMSLNLFSQYYFGIVNSLLLTADQKGYVQYTSHIFTIILNTLMCYILVSVGCSIQIVKLSTSVIYLLRPLYMSWYVNKHYNLNKKVILTEEPIKQKWNGIAQHLASFVLVGTDNIVLTLFSTLENVSIYSVYHLVVNGITNLFYSVTNGIQSLFGNMIANNETKKLRSAFSYFDWIVHTLVTLVFGSLAILLEDFIAVYTKNVSDADYHQTLFSYLIVLAYAFQVYRIPYHVIIKASGHYKQTQKCYFVAMLINIVISVSTVYLLGLVGVAIGTLSAMVYQTVWTILYDSKNIIEWPIINCIKQFAVDFLIIIVASLATFKISMQSVTYFSWIILGFKVFGIWLVITLVINYIFYKKNMKSLLQKMKRKVSKGA